MQLRAGPALRWSRSALVAGVAMGIGAIAHVHADGLLPGWSAMVVLYAALTGGIGMLLGHPSSTRQLVVLTCGGQLFVHSWLTLLAGHGETGHAPGSEVLMTLVHLGAATVVALWLGVGEQALWTLLVLLAARLAPLLRPPAGPVAPPRSVPAEAPDVLRPALVVLARSLDRRGPPVGAAR